MRERVGSDVAVRFREFGEALGKDRIRLHRSLRDEANGGGRIPGHPPCPGAGQRAFGGHKGS
jgi:hypothetical protein